MLTHYIWRITLTSQAPAPPQALQVAPASTQRYPGPSGSASQACGALQARCCLPSTEVWAQNKCLGGDRGAPRWPAQVRHSRSKATLPAPLICSGTLLCVRAPPSPKQAGCACLRGAMQRALASARSVCPQFGRPQSACSSRSKPLYPRRPYAHGTLAARLERRLQSVLPRRCKATCRRGFRLRASYKHHEFFSSLCSCRGAAGAARKLCNNLTTH